MSSVKENIVRIVNGLPPLEPKNLVDVKPDEVVVKAATVPFAVVGTEVVHPEPEEDPTGFSGEPPAQSVQKPYIRFGMYGHTDFILPRIPCDFSSVVAGPLVLNQ